MKIKFVFLIVSLFLFAAVLQAQDEREQRCISRQQVVWHKKYSAICHVVLVGYYDESKKNFEDFELLVAYSYNPGPGTKRWDYLERKSFPGVVPADGKARFKLLAIDRNKGAGDHDDGIGVYTLDDEGKCMAVAVDVKFDGKQQAREKAMKAKIKLKLVDKKDAGKDKRL